MDKKQFEANIAYLEENDIKLSSTPVWPDKPFSVELECYTDAGGDMIINLEEPTKKALEEYIENFDINDEVMVWWQNGLTDAKKRGLPFDNIGDHYEDLKQWLNNLREIAASWPDGKDVPNSNDDTIVVPENAETIEITLSEADYPAAYKAKMEELLEQDVFKTEAEARAWLRQCPITLELIYEKHSGLFAVESDAIDTGTLVSPYSKKPIRTPEG